MSLVKLINYNKNESRKAGKNNNLNKFLESSYFSEEVIKENKNFFIYNLNILINFHFTFVIHEWFSAHLVHLLVPVFVLNIT